MGINVSLASVGISQNAAPDAASARGSPRGTRVDPPERIEALQRAPDKSEGVPDGVPGAADPADSKSLIKAIEEANAVAEVALRASHRSVEFSHDDTSGRITITIKEEVDGKEVSRQIPPSQFLKIVERLRDVAERSRPRGALFDLDV